MNVAASNPSAEPTEAVIISGPRKGEIIHLQQQFDDVNPQDLHRINEALDELNAALDRLSQEVRAGTTSMRSAAERH